MNCWVFCALVDVDIPGGENSALPLGTLRWKNSRFCGRIFRISDGTILIRALSHVTEITLYTQETRECRDSV